VLLLSFYHFKVKLELFRSEVIRGVSTLSSNENVKVLVGMPCVIVLLGYLRSSDDKTNLASLIISVLRPGVGLVPPLSFWGTAEF
jgi:hypothetical protein